MAFWRHNHTTNLMVVALEVGSGFSRKKYMFLLDVQCMEKQFLPWSGERSRNQEVEMQIIPIIYSAPLPPCSTLGNLCYPVAEVFLSCNNAIMNQLLWDFYVEIPKAVEILTLPVECIRDQPRQKIPTKTWIK